MLTKLPAHVGLWIQLYSVVVQRLAKKKRKMEVDENNKVREEIHEDEEDDGEIRRKITKKTTYQLEDDVSSFSFKFFVWDGEKVRARVRQRMESI